jgi:4-hydroxythreonine-4-phosphate dehydrogenase
MGDPAGIGSEITAKMLARERISDLCIPIVIADARVVRQGFEIIGAEPNIEVIHDLSAELAAGKNYV